jgi:hypothetical protein
MYLSGLAAAGGLPAQPGAVGSLVLAGEKVINRAIRPG